MDREFTIVMRDGERFVIQASSPVIAECMIIKSTPYKMRDIQLTYEVKYE